MDNVWWPLGFKGERTQIGCESQMHVEANLFRFAHHQTLYASEGRTRNEGDHVKNKIVMTFLFHGTLS